MLFLERFLKRGIIPRMTELEGNLQGQQDDPLAGIQRPSEGGAELLSCLLGGRLVSAHHRRQNVCGGSKRSRPKAPCRAVLEASAQASWASAHLTLSLMM